MVMALSPSPSPAKNPLKISFLPSVRRYTPFSMSAPRPRLSVDAGHREEVLTAARAFVPHCLSETHLELTVPGLKAKARRKVRDIYEGKGYMVLVTTDRQSAFDRVLASIPSKGQVLNKTSLWWFNKAEHIVPNAVVCSPDKNVTIANKCSVFPVEFVVRGYVTGSTDTSLWTVYNNGRRNYCGNILPDGMKKNQKLPANILTPTTKATNHDVPVSPDEHTGIMCDLCNGSGWLICDFCKGQKTNVKSKSSRFYRRCPYCKAVGLVLCPKCKVFKCVTFPDFSDSRA